MKHLKYILLLVIIAITISCEKEQSKRVVYKVSSNDTDFLVLFRDAQGQLIEDLVQVASAEDKWLYGFEAEEGQILYVAAYKDKNESCKVEILIDGKNFKQNFLTGDTTAYVIASGTVPFE